MTHASIPLCSLKKRHRFLALTRTGRKVFLPAAVVQIAPCGDVDTDADKDGIRFGLTVSKKNGNAVRRNRCRRRLRALAKELLPEYGAAGHDYVLIARRESFSRPYRLMRKELRSALKRLSRKDVHHDG